MDSLTKKKENRFRFLHALYEETDGSSGSPVSPQEIGRELDFSRDETDKVVGYLMGENLVEQLNWESIGITHSGVVEVERALSEPEKPTQYFPPVVNIMHIHSIVNSPIQQGTYNSQQSLTVNQNDIATVRNFLQEFTRSLKGLSLPDDTLREVEADVASIEAQLQSPKPKKGIVTEGLQSIRSILESVGASAIASVLLPKLLPILTGLGG